MFHFATLWQIYSNYILAKTRETNVFTKEILGCEIQDVSTSISIAVMFLIWLVTKLNESDKYVEARDRRYLCLKLLNSWFNEIFFRWE